MFSKIAKQDCIYDLRITIYDFYIFTQMKNDDKSVKILFRYYSNVLDEETVETMWAIPIDEAKGLYKLDNIPFYGPLVASDDIVFAEYDESELMLTYRRTEQYSGNSIIQVILVNDGLEINEVRKVFEDRGCLSERVNDKYFAMGGDSR